MAYSDKTYFLQNIKESELNKLILNDAGAPQESYLTAKVKAADEIIDSYIRKITKSLPLNPVPETVKQMSYFIATYFLHVRANFNDIPELVKNNYELAIAWLKDVASGKAELILTEAQQEDVEVGVKYDGDEPVFTRNLP